MVNFDKEYQTNKIKLIAGVDEAGRGPLAGPVAVASVIMPLDRDIVEGVNDKQFKKRYKKRFRERSEAFCVICDFLFSLRPR